MGLASWVCVNADVLHTGITSYVIKRWKIALANTVDYHSVTIDFVKTFPQLAPVRSDYWPLVAHSDEMCNLYLRCSVLIIQPANLPPAFARQGKPDALRQAV